jgi:hypothetical protein
VLEVRRQRGVGTRAASRSVARTGGSEGNSRLTASTAVVLLVLLAAEGVTLVSIRPLVSAHIFIGMLLLPPVALKVASTGYRFARYYAGHRAYREEGPPHPLLRLLGPVVVLSTAALFASGVALAVLGPDARGVLGLHQASFAVWLAAMSAHVLGHLLPLPRMAAADWRRHEALPGSSLRRWLLAASVVAGVILAVATVHLAGPWHQFIGFDD